jgi:TPR repeat protein
MDDPFDENGNLTDIAKTLFDQEEYSFVYGDAERGDADAQYKMGIWHLDGGNTLADKDKNRAVKWLTKAAEKGHENAKKALEQISLAKEEPKHLTCYVCLAGLETYSYYEDCANCRGVKKDLNKYFDW